MGQVAIVTHSEAIYDKRGAIAQAISNLSGLEQILITSQPNRTQDSVNSADGCLKVDEAQDLVSRYDAISLFGGCLNVCHYQTYESLVKAFKNSQKKKLTIKFSLDGIFGDYFPSIDAAFNLNEILEFNGDVGNREAREQAVLSLFEKYVSCLEDVGINSDIKYNGSLIYRNKQRSGKLLTIEIFDKAVK